MTKTTPHTFKPGDTVMLRSPEEWVEVAPDAYRRIGTVVSAANVGVRLRWEGLSCVYLYHWDELSHVDTAEPRP